MMPVLNGLSIDVEEAFHASAFEDDVAPERWASLPRRAPPAVDRLLELLAKRAVKATFFTLGWVAQHSPEVVRRIHAAGHEVACHGFSHRRVYHQTPAAFRQDVSDARSRLEDLIGARVRGYRAPTYSITPHSLWAIDVLAELGFEYDSSIFPVRHDRYGFPGAPRFPYRIRTPGGASMVEIPPTSLSLGIGNLPVAGGGYLRLYPLLVTRAAIDLINRLEGQPAFVYLHPWEIDPEQPRLSTKRLAWWRHTVNQGRTLQRLEALLLRFRFAPFQEVVHTHAGLPIVRLEPALSGPA